MAGFVDGSRLAKVNRRTAVITVFGDIIADLALRVPTLPIAPGSLSWADAASVGPGGACNTAIQAVRLGMEVAVVGEVGDDGIGVVVVHGLGSAGIDTSAVVVSEGGETPVAGIIVGAGEEAAYVGYRGTLRVGALTDDWRRRIRASDAVFANGWVVNDSGGPMVLEVFSHARSAGVPVFFDPGPGSPDLDNSWHTDAARRATVVMATEAEATRITGCPGTDDAARTLLEWGAELAVVKRGSGGCLLARAGELVLSPSLPVQVVDTTAAGDAVDAAVIRGYLQAWSLEEIGVIANAVGAAKVTRAGTGLSMPTRDEICAVLARFGKPTELLQ